MGGVLFVALALPVLLASPASFSKPFQPFGMVDVPAGIIHDSICPGMSFGSPVAGTGGFQVVPSYLLNSPGNIARSIWPLVRLPPFQAMFRGPTVINGHP